MNHKISLSISLISFLTLLNVSCSKDDDVKVAPVGGMIATVDNTSWSSSQTVAVISNGNISIVGLNADGSQIVISVTATSKGKFSISGTVSSVPDNSVSYTPTNPSLDNPTYSSVYLTVATVGEVNISEIDETDKTISGTFNSKISRLLPEEKTILVKSGSFNKIPYTSGIGSPDNTFSAKVNSAAFTATNISGTEALGKIVLSFTNGTKIMALSLPATTNTGTFSVGSLGADYYGTFSDNGTQYSSTTGSITINLHDKTNDRIEGTFSFNGTVVGGSGTVTITNGSFAVSY